MSIPAINTFSKLYPNAKITALLSKEPGKLPENVEYKKSICNLKDHVYEYDLVVTHYGLTAYEAAYAGCALILLPTSKLHVNLAKKYNFAYIADSHRDLVDVVAVQRILLLLLQDDLGLLVVHKN